MKYKAIFTINNEGGGSPDVASSHSFYTFIQADKACQEWGAFNSANGAYLWDGAAWRFYS
jgi:hypothetical protein